MIATNHSMGILSSIVTQQFPQTDISSTLDGSATSVGDVLPSLALTIAYHPRLERVGQQFVFAGVADDKPLRLSREEPLFGMPNPLRNGPSGGAPLAIMRVSREPILFRPQSNGSVRIDVSPGAGDVTIGQQSIRGSVLVSPRDVQRGVVITLGRRVVLVLHRASSSGRIIDDERIAEEIIGVSDGIRGVRWKIRAVADLEERVLIRGESGTGKELVARCIHAGSRRSAKKIVKVNMGSVTPTLAQDELFGHVKGAYTNAVDRRLGHFEKAHDSTLFLDEIGEAPVEVQVSLLRAIETGEILPVGMSDPVKVNVRLVAATDANLESSVAEGTFRTALLNRLSAYVIWVPPLRERREDIGLLFARFLREALKKTDELHHLEAHDESAKPWLSASIVARFIDDDWRAGNVRQLRNAVDQLVIENRWQLRAEITPEVARKLSEHSSKVQPMAISETVEVASSAQTAIEMDDDDDEPGRNGGDKWRRPSEVKEDELCAALEENRWDLSKAAKQLGIGRSSMYNLRDRYGCFRVPEDIPDTEVQDAHTLHDGNREKMVETLKMSEKQIIKRLKKLKLM